MKTAKGLWTSMVVSEEQSAIQKEMIPVLEMRAGGSACTTIIFKYERYEKWESHIDVGSKEFCTLEKSDKRILKHYRLLFSLSFYGNKSKEQYRVENYRWKKCGKISFDEWNRTKEKEWNLGAASLATSRIPHIWLAEVAINILSLTGFPLDMKAQPNFVVIWFVTNVMKEESTKLKASQSELYVRWTNHCARKYWCNCYTSRATNQDAVQCSEHHISDKFEENQFY